MTQADAFLALESLVNVVGGGFHTDNRFEDYVDVNGDPAFTQAEVEEYNTLLDAAVQTLGRECAEEFSCTLVMKAINNGTQT